MPTWQSRTFAQQSHTTSTPTCSLPAGCAVGDYIVIVVLTDNIVINSVVPSDSEIASIQTAGANSQRAWIRKLTSGDISGGIVTINGASSLFTDIGVHRVTGVDPTTPIGASGSSSAKGTSTTPTGSSVTVSVDGSLLLRLETALAGPRTAGVSGMTNVSSDDSAQFLCDTLAVNSGSTGSKASTQSPSGNWIVHMVALQPAAAGSPPIIYGAQQPISLYQSNRAVPTYVGTQFFPGFSQGGFSGSAALSSFGASGTMLVTFAATGSAAMSSFASSGSAAETFTGSGSAAVSSFATSGTASETFAATGSAALSSFACSGTATEGFACTGSAALSSFASSGSGAETFTSSGTAACSPFGATGNSSTGTTFTCSGTAALSSFAASGNAAETFAATGSAALSSFAAVGSAAEAFISSGSAALQPFTASGNAAMGTVFVFSGSAALSSFGASGAGSEAFVGAGTAALSPFAAAGVGNLLTAITGSGSAALSSFSAAGSAATLLDIAFSGSAALSPFGALGGDPLVYLPGSKSRWVTAVDLSPFVRFGPPFKVGGT